MIVVKVRDREIRVAPTAPVTSGSVGLPVTWTFSEEWEGLTKTAVFRGSDTARDVVLTEDACVVPADVLEESGGPLEIGVRGVKITHDEDADEDIVTVVIPTIWGRIDRIYDGTIPSEADPSVPEPDWTEQVKAAAAEALLVAQGVRQDADDGVFDGASAYEQAVAGGYDGTEAEFNADLAGFSEKEQAAMSAAEAAAQSAQNAANSASTAATKSGEAAQSAATASTHKDAASSSAQSAANSATSAGNSASAAAASASAANSSATSASTSESNAANSATNAAASETAAAASESAAAASATAASNSAAAAAQSASAIEEYEHDAEAWAIGKRGGTDVDTSDETYQNNAKYYAEQAAASSSSASSAASAAAQSATDAASEAASSQSYSRSSYISSTMASGSATAAAEAQTAAETAASTAEGHATNAASSATAASGSATAAAQSATEAGNASTAATTAKEAAEDAQESAEALVQSIAQSAEQIAQNTADISTLKSALENVGGYDSLYTPEWEQGNITVTDYSLVYSDGTTRCRFIEGLKPIFVLGTKIEVTDPVYRFSILYSGTDEKWYGQGNQTAHTVPSANRRYALVVWRSDWHVILPDEASAAIKITLPFSQYKRNTESFYKTFSLKDQLSANGMFFSSGNGLAAGSTTSKVSEYIPVIAGQSITYDLSAGANSGRYVICLYDEEFNFLSGVEGIGGGVLTVSANGYVRFGCLNNYDGYAYFDYAVPDKIQAKIDAINKTLVSDVTGTDYMQTALTRITGELKQKSVLGNIVTFGFSTDQHIKDDNDATATLPVLRGLKVLSKLTQAYPYDFICLGGDACEAGSYATTLNRILDECITIQKPLYDAWCPVVPLTGNHDAAQNNNAITGGMLFNAHFKRVANSGFIDGWDSTHTNGYWDSEAHKIRFIFFDDTTRADYTSTELNTVLSEMVSGTPEGYNMVILSHHPLSQSLTDSHWQNPVYADDILTPYASRIICCICGHSHADISETQNGILYIATTLAMYGYDQDAQRGTLNTETETAFDTFVIDQTNKHIYAIRYGHGENRDWAYTLT